jgi:hypothetical protein
MVRKAGRIIKKSSQKASGGLSAISHFAALLSTPPSQPAAIPMADISAIT